MNRTDPVRLLIVDDDALVREALEFVFDIPQIQVVGSVGDGPMAIEAVATLKPEVVLMDVRMPGMSGIEATREITARHPEVVVLVHSAHSDHRSIQEAQAAGAAGYVVKGDRMEKLVSRVLGAAPGGEEERE